jgi:predicted amidohydrolase
MRIAVFQMQALPGKVELNLALIEDAAIQAAVGGAELLIAPELATVGYGSGDAISANAEPRTGQQVTALAAIASAQRLAIIAGFPEGEGGKVYNSAVLADGRTEPVVYRKSQLYGEYERSIFSPGEPTAVVAKLGSLTVGMLICYDVEFPENVRRLALAGADLVAVPTALPAVPEAALIIERMIPVRAFENQIFVAYANHASQDDLFAYAGSSHIAAPDGATLAKASDSEIGIIFADVDPEKYAASRETNNYIRDLLRG